MPILNLPLDRSLYRRLDEAAKAEDRTPARQAIYLLRQALGVPPPGPAATVGQEVRPDAAT